MNFIKMVQQEIYDWGMMNNYPPLTPEEYFRLDGSIEMRTIRRNALLKQNMIWSWFVYGSPDFKEYEHISVQDSLPTRKPEDASSGRRIPVEAGQLLKEIDPRKEENE